MAIMKLEKSAWHSYFDHMSKLLEGKRAEVEVGSLSIGNQIEADWLPLLGIVYEPKSDLMEILLEGLDHMIAHPKEVYVDQEAGLLKSMEVVDAEDMREIIRLRDPLMLPAPG